MASGAGEVYALVDPCPASRCSNGGYLYRSPAGHDAWTEVAGPLGNFANGPDRYALVVESNAVFVMSATPSPQLLSSLNGVDFTALSIPCATGSADGGPYLPAAVAASDPSDLSMVCQGLSGTGNEFKEAFISHDGGRVFARLPDPSMGGDSIQLAMPSPTTLLLSSSSAATSITRITAPDIAWDASLGFADQGLGIADLAFVDPSQGAFVHVPATIALGVWGLPSTAESSPGDLYLSDNDGSTWVETNPPLPSG